MKLRTVTVTVHTGYYLIIILMSPTTTKSQM